MMNYLRYVKAFTGWCLRKLFGSTITNVNSKHQWFYGQLQRYPFLTMVGWFFVTLFTSTIFALVLLVLTEDRELSWLLIRGFFWLSFGYMMLGHLINAHRAFVHERQDLFDTLRDFK